LRIIVGAVLPKVGQFVAAKDEEMAQWLREAQQRRDHGTQ
jgi:hypothetical protein